MGRAAAGGSSLSGLRVLVVEDMFLIADDIARQLESWGCHVIGPDGRIEDALDRIEKTELDGALLDVNLHGEPGFAVAARLAARGVPFIFMTGFDQQAAFPSEFQSSQRLTKPVAARSLASMMERQFVRQAAPAFSSKIG
jgi:CheY-like chemotaxis protein